MTPESETIKKNIDNIYDFRKKKNTMLKHLTNGKRFAAHVT